MEDNIEVAIRIRPLLDKEIKEKLPIHWHIDGESIFQVDQQGNQLFQPFTFDHIFSEERSNAEVFNSVVHPLIESGMAGYNSTVFAYGQTSSGKTYTMLGCEEHQGIIPLAIENIFESINSNLERKYLLRLSYIEIYNDIIIDLLDETPKTIKIRENFDGTIHLNVEEEVINTTKQAYSIIEKGEKRRKYGITQANQRSSRSHTIFRIVIESTPINEDAESDIPVHVSHINLVDLAGSERASHTKATGVRLREGGQINKSLHQLSMVIRQLSEGKEYTSFRDSKLTRILKDSLGGNAKTLIIGTITPTSIEDSHSTLNFTYRAKTIKNKPTVNEIRSSDVLTKQFIQKEKQLQKQLAAMQRDKELLEGKHAQLIHELSSYKQQFVTSSKTSKEEKRRHTLCFGNVKPKVDSEDNNRDFKFPLDNEFINRKSRLRKESSLLSWMEDSVTPRKMEISNFSDTTSKLDNNSIQKIRSFEEVYKQMQNLIAADLSDHDNKDLLRSGLQKMYNIFRIHVSEPQELTISEQIAQLSSNSNQEFLDIPQRLLNNNINDVFVAPDCVEEKLEETACNNDILKMKEEEEDSEQQSDETGDYSITKLLKENQILKSKVKDVKKTLDKVQEENTTLKSNISDLQKILMNTEDELLAVDEQLDFQERQTHKVQQEYNEVSIQIKDLQLENEHLNTQLRNILANNETVREAEEQPEDKHVMELEIHKKKSIPINISHNSSRNELESIKYMSHNFLDSITNDTHSSNCSFTYPERFSCLYGDENVDNDVKSALTNLYYLLCFDSKTVNEEQMHVSISESNLKEMLPGNDTPQKNEMGTINDNHTSLIEISSMLADINDTIAESFNDNINETKEEEVEEDNSFFHDPKADIIERITVLKNSLDHKEKLHNRLSEKYAVLHERLNQHAEINAELNEEIFTLQNKLTQQEELNTHLNEEIAILQQKLNVPSTEDKLEQQKELYAQLTEENNSLQNKLKQKEELNIRLNEEITVLQETFDLQIQVNTHLTEENGLLNRKELNISSTKQSELDQPSEVNIHLIEDKLNHQELSVTSNKEDSVLLNELDQQRILNIQLNEEKCSLKTNLAQKEYEISCLITERDSIRERLIQHEQLNTKLSEEIYQLENSLAKQQSDTAKLIEEKEDNKLSNGQDCVTEQECNDQEDIYLKEQLLHQQQLNGKLTEEQHLLKNEITQEQFNNKKLLEENNLLNEKLIRLEELNVKLKEEANRLIKEQNLFKDEIAQERSNTKKLLEEKSLLNEKLTQLEGFNTKLTENLSVLKNDNVILEEETKKLIEKQNLLKDEIAQEQSNTKKLLEEKNLLNEKPTQLEESNAKLTEDLFVLKNGITQEQFNSKKLLEENNLLNEKLIQLEELNIKLKERANRLIKEQNLLKDEIAQEQSNTKKLLEEKNLLNEKLIQLEGFNTKLTENLSVLKNDNVILEEETKKLIEKQNLLKDEMAQEQFNTKELLQEKNLLHEKFIHWKELNTKLTEDLCVFQNDNIRLKEDVKKLILQEQLIFSLENKLTEQNKEKERIIEEKNHIKEKLVQHEQEFKDFVNTQSLENKSLNEEYNILKQQLLEYEQLINKLKEELHHNHNETTQLQNNNKKLIEEKILLKNKLDQQEQDNFKLLNEKNAINDKLKLQELLNGKLSEDISILQDNITKQQVESVEITEIEKKLTNIEKLNDQLIQEKCLLQNKLNKQEQDNLKVLEEKNLLQNKLTDQEQENKQLIEENTLLNGKLIEKNYLLQNNFTKLEQDNLKLLEKKNLLQNKLIAQEQHNKQLIENNTLLNGKLIEEKCLLQDNLIQLKQDNLKLVEEKSFLEKQNSLLIKESAEKCLLQINLNKQEQINLELLQEKNLIQKKLINQEQQNKHLVEENTELKTSLVHQKQLNKKLTEDICVIKNDNIRIAEKEEKLTKQKELLANLIKERNLVRNNLVKQQENNEKLKIENCNVQGKLIQQEQLNLILQTNTQETINKLQIDKKKLIEEKIQLSHTILTLSEEKQNLQKRINDQQQENSNQLQVEKHLKEKTLAKYREHLSMLIEKYNTSNISTSDYQQTLQNTGIFNNNTNAFQKSTADEDYDNELQILTTKLHDIIKTKDEEIKDLDKEIVDTVHHVHSLEKVIKDQREQLSQFKTHQVSKLKSQEMSLTDFKRRRSITQDSNRSLDSLELPLLCPTCNVTDSMELNQALLRENRRKNIEIAKLESDIRNLKLQHKELHDEYKTITVKYKKMKEVAVMRGNELKNYQKQT